MKNILIAFLLFFSFVAIKENNLKADKINSLTPCQNKIDSLTWVIKAKDYRLNRVRFYVKLVDKKPSQAKFLRGWIKRAIQ